MLRKSGNRKAENSKRKTESGKPEWGESLVTPLQSSLPGPARFRLCCVDLLLSRKVSSSHGLFSCSLFWRCGLQALAGRVRAADMLHPKTATRARNAVATRILGLWAPFPPACFLKRWSRPRERSNYFSTCSFV